MTWQLIKAPRLEQAQTARFECRSSFMSRRLPTKAGDKIIRKLSTLQPSPSARRFILQLHIFNLDWCQSTKTMTSESVNIGSIVISAPKFYLLNVRHSSNLRTRHFQLFLPSQAACIHIWRSLSIKKLTPSTHRTEPFWLPRACFILSHFKATTKESNKRGHVVIIVSRHPMEADGIPTLKLIY